LLAGWNAEEMLDAVDGVMMAAAASGEDLATVSDIVTKKHWSVARKLAA